MHPDPINRHRPRLTAAAVTAAGLAVGIPAVIALAAAVEFTAQARKVTFGATRRCERRGT